ncbi:MAG: DUF4262 domain-containing protein [Reichenbachiella sp.]
MKIEKNHSCRNDAKTISDIEKYGLTVIILEATEYLPSFAYSIGLWQNYQHPEIIMFGLNTNSLHQIINDVADLVKEGQQIETGKNYPEILVSGRTEFLNVDNRNLSNYFGTAIDFYNSKNFNALQVIWPDRNNKLPWENEFEDEFRYKQPLLDRNATFKFREEKNMAAFTTRQWLDLNRPILRVIHDLEGDWQFLTGDQLPEDIKIVALEQLVLRDESLNEVFDLDYGEEAERETENAKWIRRKAELVEEE